MKEGQPFSPYGLFTGIFIPEVICRSTELSPGAKIAYGRLCRYAGQDGRCFPLVATLGAEIGVEQRQARRYIAELETAGFIRRQKRSAVAGDLTSNEIVFLWHKSFSSELHDLTPGQIGPDLRSDPAVPPLSETDLKLKESLDWVAVDFLKRVREENHLKEQQQQGPMLTQSEWPLTTFAVQSRFPSADSFFVLRLIQESVQAAVSLGIEGDLSDRKLSQIVCESIQEDFARPGRTAGLLLKTVPQIIRSRVKTFEVQQKIMGRK